MQNTSIKLSDTPVFGFLKMTCDAVYALEQNFGTGHYD
jgi:hypothetical protein